MDFTSAPYSQYLLVWAPVQQHRHVQSEVSPNLTVTNTRAQEEIPGISGCRKDWRSQHFPAFSQSSMHRPLHFKSQLFPDSGLEAPALLQISIARSSYAYLKTNKRETGYYPEINSCALLIVETVQRLASRNWHNVRKKLGAIRHDSPFS